MVLAQARSEGSALAQARREGLALAQARSEGSALAQARNWAVRDLAGAKLYVGVSHYPSGLVQWVTIVHLHHNDNVACPCRR